MTSCWKDCVTYVKGVTQKCLVLTMVLYLQSKRSSKQALLKRYPPRLHDDSIEDEDSVKQNKSAMASEISKRKPRKIVVLPLLRSTYSTRRDYITSDEREDVKEILEEYPALRLPAAVSFMSIIIHLHTRRRYLPKILWCLTRVHGFREW